MTPEEYRAFVIAKGATDFAFFSAFFFPHYVKTEIPDFHLDAYDALPTIENYIRAWPREHAKTTICSILYPLWCIAYRKKRFILIVSDTSTQAESILLAVKSELETNELYISHFGFLFNPAKWAIGDFITTTDTRVIGRGTGASLRGLRHKDSRVDLAIGDDLENDEMVRTKAQREKMRLWFDRVFQNVGGPGCQIIVVGTILNPHALLPELLEREGWDTKKLAAIREDGSPLWPEVWTPERLEKKKHDIGQIAFATEYLNEPMEDGETVVRYDTLSFVDPEEIPRDLEHYGYVDPAISRKETGDYFAMATAGYSAATGTIYILELFRDRLAFKKQVGTVALKHEGYNYVQVGVEEVAYQEALKQAIEDDAPNVPVVGVKVDTDKIRRLVRITPKIESAVVRFSKKVNPDFIDELTSFPKGEHDDTVDAFSGVVQLILDRISMKPDLFFA